MGQASSSSPSSVEEDPTLSLPDECLAWIFSKLGCQDRNSCSLVCKRWRLVDSKSRQRLLLVARSDLSPSFPALLSRFCHVSVLSLKCSRKLTSIDDDALSRIPTFLSSLRKLKLKGCVHITDQGLQAFSSHHPPFLTKLSFACCGFGGRGILSLLQNCPSLHDLTLKRLRKLDDLDHPLCEQHNLQRLCLKDLHNARLFVPLLRSSAHTLKTLIVSRSSGNWDPVLQSVFAGDVQANSSIVDIQMESVQLGDAGLFAIASSCPDLRVLYLSRATDCTDDGLSAIANTCTKLRKLHIDAWSRFGSRTIGEEGFLSIASKCIHLQELVLMGVPITVASLGVLASSCPALERMALCNVDSVGDLEMQLIGSKFSALKKLCIKNCPITDRGVKAVGEGCPSLVKLKVKRCRGVSQAGVSKLSTKKGSLVVWLDSESMQFDGEREVEDELEEERRMRNGRRSRSRSTHVICSSRGAMLLRSSFENVLQLNRRHSLSTHPST